MVLKKYLEILILEYLDNILVFFLEKHIKYFCLVLNKLRKAGLYDKLKKCKFTLEELVFWVLRTYPMTLI